MEKEIKIAIIGIGGVGGYLGAMLARRYSPESPVKLYFIARGAHGDILKRNGITLQSKRNGKFTAKPAFVTDNAAECGTMDYIIYCTKSYDVENGIKNILPAIGPETVILPFMNGVDGTETIKKMLPGHTIWDGCVFIMAYISAPGIICEEGTMLSYYFCSKNDNDFRMSVFEKICTDAGIAMSCRKDIELRVWNKFSYISPLATLSTRYNLTAGQITQSPHYSELIKELYREFLSVAQAKKVEISDNIETDNLEKLHKTPTGMTTSMQRDFYKGKTTELESLTGYIVREGKRLHVPTPLYEKLYDEIKSIRL